MGISEGRALTVSDMWLSTFIKPGALGFKLLKLCKLTFEFREFVPGPVGA